MEAACVLKTAGIHCPRCRSSMQRPDCSACGTQFLEVDGILCLADPEELRHEQGAMLADDWLAVDTDSLQAVCAKSNALDPASTLYRERSLEGLFALSHFSRGCSVPIMERELERNETSLAELAHWIDAHPAPIGTPVPVALEVGCGPGRMLLQLAKRFPLGAVGLDIRLGMLRIARRMADHAKVMLPWRADGITFEPLLLCGLAQPAAPITLLQGSLYDSPLAPGAYPLVTALSLLDTLPDPMAGLDALDALVAPDGLLLLACPYQWHSAVTPRERWLSSPESTLRSALNSRGYSILEEDLQLPWVIPSNLRLVHRYFLHALLARKPCDR